MNQKLDPNKAHSHDMISMQMLKISGKSNCRPLELIFNECISNENLPSEGKNESVLLQEKQEAKFEGLSPCFVTSNF